MTVAAAEFALAALASHARCRVGRSAAPPAGDDPALPTPVSSTV